MAEIGWRASPIRTSPRSSTPLFSCGTTLFRVFGVKVKVVVPHECQLGGSAQSGVQVPPRPLRRPVLGGHPCESGPATQSPSVRVWVLLRTAVVAPHGGDRF